MKRPHTSFHAHTMRVSHVLFGQKKSQNLSLHQNLWLGQTFLAGWSSFSLYRYFIETTTTDIDMRLQV